MSNDDRLIGTNEAAQMLGIDRSTLIRWVQQGKIAAAGKSHGYVFAYAVVARLAAARRAA